MIHFSRSEFTCRCGCGFDTVDYELGKLLDAIRAHFDQPVTVTSGCRCEAHNRAVGGSSNSQHLYGRAADIVVRDTPAEIVQVLAEEMGVPGLGRYQDFTHVDTRTGRARW